jgi:hypothetical protein
MEFGAFEALTGVKMFLTKFVFHLLNGLVIQYLKYIDFNLVLVLSCLTLRLN